MYIASNGELTFRFFYGRVSVGKGEDAKVSYSVENNFPPFAKLIIDYLIGTYSIQGRELYDVRGKQFKRIDEYALQNKYGFKDSTHVLDILLGVHKHLNHQGIRKMEPYKIAGKDFIIDLETNKILDESPKQNISYFKYYDVDYQTALSYQPIAKEYLETVIADENSLHNATLQAYYIAQVSAGVRAKTNFFISKSGVRTGKGLRHIALSALYKKIDVELDTLKTNGFESLQAWAMFSGGEMALATEQGDIQGQATERVLKIIATEKSHVARSIGQNQSLVTLSSVLCVDTNRTVALSDEMNGRSVLIEFKNRPKEETDIQREAFFKKYWDAFTYRDKEPKIESCIAFLLNSIEYFNSIGNQYQWKKVELYNDINLDDFQVELIQALQEIDFVQRTGNKEVIELSNQVYGKNMNALGESLSELGVRSISKKVNGKTVRGYVIENRERFEKFI
ncbi:phage resistance protein [Facklamia languida]